MILYEVTAADKILYLHDSFLIPPLKHMLWLLNMCLDKTFLMNTHNIWFYGEIRNMPVKKNKRAVMALYHTPEYHSTYSS